MPSVTGWSVAGITGRMNEARTINVLAEEMTKAREQGALFHSTNPVDAWFCTECCVFGRDTAKCWCCDSAAHLKFKWTPRFGGGAHNHIEDPEA